MSNNFNYGGQAVMEGVMMRGSRHLAVAVRAPDESIVVHEEPLNSALYNGIWSRIPFVRGLGLLWDSVGLGTRALLFSANVAVGDEAEFSGPVAWGTVAFSFALAVALIFLLPAAVADGIHKVTGLNSSFAGNIIEGVVRLGVVISYIWLVGRIPDIQRVFQYHGAEHKVINAYEDGAPLTPESVDRYPLEHPRCGTGFLLVVVVISILVFALIGRPSLLMRFASRIVLIPIVVGIAYEYLRFMARHKDNAIVRVLIAPQLALQRLTTRPPTHDMLEVSIKALQVVLAAEHLPQPGQLEKALSDA